MHTRFTECFILSRKMRIWRKLLKKKLWKFSTRLIQTGFLILLVKDGKLYNQVKQKVLDSTIYTSFLMIKSLKRFTLDVDYAGLVFWILLPLRLRLFLGRYFIEECVSSPSGHGWHLVIYSGKTPSTFLRVCCGDDVARAVLDQRRPKYAQQVLFNSKCVVTRTCGYPL